VKSLASNVRSVLQSAPEVGPLERLRRGFVLFEQQQDVSGLFLIESGLVKLIRTSSDGRTFILSVVGPHQVAGLEGLALMPAAHAADSVCLSEVTGYHIPLPAARRLLALPEYATALRSHLIARDQERIQRIEMLTLCDVEQRVLHALANLAEMVRPIADGDLYPIPITQIELASFVGATRETTSSTLSSLQNRQLVTLGRRLVTVVQPHILREAAHKRRPLSEPAIATSLTAAAS